MDDSHVSVWFQGQRAMPARSPNALETCLDPALLLRANCNTLVNLRHIASIDPWANDGYQIKLRDANEVEVSRRQSRELRDRLSPGADNPPKADMNSSGSWLHLEVRGVSR